MYNNTATKTTPGSKLRGSIGSACGDDEDDATKNDKEIGTVLNDEALDQVITQQHQTTARR